MSRIHILKGFSDLDGALWVLKYHPELRTQSDIISIILKNGITVIDKSRFEVMQLLGEWGLVDRKPAAIYSKRRRILFFVGNETGYCH